MKPVVSDPFPRQIEVLRGKRRSLEVSLEQGRFIARVPRRANEAKFRPIINEMREKLWQRVQRESVFDNIGLQARAVDLASRYLSDQKLPPFTVRFSSRQKKRWGSCTFDGSAGSIRLSSHLIGHPTWLIDEVLLHEIAHLVHQNHGPQFRELLQRSPHYDRGKGYLEAVSHIERFGKDILLTLRAPYSDKNKAALRQESLF